MSQQAQESRFRVSHATEEKVNDVITTNTELNPIDLRGMAFERRLSIAIRALENSLDKARDKARGASGPGRTF